MWLAAVAQAAIRDEPIPTLPPEAEGAALNVAETLIKWRAVLDSKFKK